MPSKFYKKYIRIPPDQSIDIRPVLPIVHHPRFQRLLFVSQLGTTLSVFPGASHNRFEHALGVYAKALRFCGRMLEEGFLTSAQARSVTLFALLHDIGHGPFSHQIEQLTPYNHDINGQKIITELKKEITACGGDITLIKKLFTRTDPLHRIVMDRNLGMDKLDYLERDTYHTAFGQRPDIESVFDYLVYIKGRMVIDKKSLEAAKQMQRLYVYMYKEVYKHKSSQIASRFLQKMIALWLTIDGIHPEQLWSYTDAELLAHIYQHDDERLRFLYQCYRSRNLPRTGIVIRLKGKLFRERVAGKDIKVIGEEKEFFDAMLRDTSPQILEQLERAVAELLKIEPHLIYVVPSIDGRRFMPEDIMYHDEGKVLSLKKTQSQYFKSLQAELEEYLSVRVCIIGNRKILYDNAARIHQLIKKFIAQQPRQSGNLSLTF
jgi:HD superfamily phosphohydrolase